MKLGSTLRKFDIPHILLFSLAYGGAIRLADILPSSANLVLALWPAGGIGLASLVLLPRRRWPAMVTAFSITGFVMAILIGRSIPASLGFMTANAFESTLCALVLTRYGSRGFNLNRVGSIAALAFSAIIVNACTALLGAATAALTSGMSFVDFWFDWWVVDGISILIITPFVLWLGRRKGVTDGAPARSIVEYVAFFVIWIGIAWFAFNSENPLTGLSPHPYLLIVLLVWPAIRFDPGPLSLAILALAVIAVSSRAILLGPSPLLGDTITLRLLFSQSFLAITSLTTWLLSASFAERRAAEQRLREQYSNLNHLNRELMAISNCNQILMRAEDEQSLLNDICRIICNEAGYRMAWVGFAENDEARTVRPVAWAGFENDYLAQASITWADTERGRGPSGTAIRNGLSVCIQDFNTDPRAAPWRETALQRGYCSSIALPLKDDNTKTFGVLNIYSAEINAFTMDEIRLLDELAGDLAFGIMVLRARGARKRVEDELLRREQEFRTLAENSPDVIVRYNREGQRIYVNPEFERVNHLTAQEVHGKTPVQLSTELAPMADVFTEKLMAAMASGSAAQVDLSWIKDGKLVCWFVRVVPEFDTDGKVTSALTIWSDITERQNAEAEIRKLNQELEQRVFDRTAQLESANRELEAFAYSVSHDLRAPLRHIDGFIEMLRERTLTSLDDQSRHYMEVIAESAWKMGALIDNLLSFSRMNRNEMSKSQVELDELVQEVIREFGSETEGRDIQWKISPLPHVTGDRAMLRVVMVNLISNALKFTRPRRIAQIEIGCETKNETELVIFVRDNGVGFNMNYADKLFGVFQRLHRQEDFEGTGIGLANVRRVVNRHGGRTWAEGLVDHGATFYFSLPQSIIETKP